jgi:hypothetical protein
MSHSLISGSVLSGPLPAEARERVVMALTRHFANDHLSEAELEARLERVYAAATSRDLDLLLADLPALPTDATMTAGAAPTSRADISALCSGQETRLVGALPRELRVHARLGYVELDLTRATFEPGITSIDVQVFMGYVEIRFPAGIRVESNGRALFGFFAFKGLRGAGDVAGTRTIVRLTGRTILGFAEGTVSCRDRLDPSPIV